MWSPRPSASCATSSTASRTPPPAWSSCPSWSPPSPRSGAARRPTRSPPGSTCGPTSPGPASPVTDDPVDLLLDNTWGASVAVTGLGGAPTSDAAGNVLRAHTEAALSIRLSPRADPAAAVRALTDALTADPPEGAVVDLAVAVGEAGWDAPPTAPWLAAALDEASEAAFGAPSGAVGVGGTIPFMGMLGRLFPDAQFVITGVLVPGSNAHGPDEFLHVPTGQAGHRRGGLPPPRPRPAHLTDQRTECAWHTLPSSGHGTRRVGGGAHLRSGHVCRRRGFDQGGAGRHGRQRRHRGGQVRRLPGHRGLVAAGRERPLGGRHRQPGPAPPGRQAGQEGRRRAPPLRLRAGALLLGLRRGHRPVHPGLGVRRLRGHPQDPAPRAASPTSVGPTACWSSASSSRGSASAPP